MSKEIKKTIKINYNNVIEDLKQLINDSNEIKWILENKKKYVSNNQTYSIIEYILVTEYLQIK